MFTSCKFEEHDKYTSLHTTHHQTLDNKILWDSYQNPIESNFQIEINSVQ